MNPIGIYLHVPFCRGKCPYCDFYSVTVSDELLDAYTDETVRRIHMLAEESITADTVYFGGGTPSLLGGKRISRLLSALGSSVTIAKNAEITVEANPSSDLRDFLSGCAASGVNRLSLGMQSAVPRELAAIGRRHAPEDVLTAMDTARALGIDNLSLDLMLGIPYQTGDTLVQSIEFIKNSAPSHVSAYMLKIEEGTPFYKAKDTLPIADDDALADLYEAAFASLEQLGYRQYEISNASREGQEGRHNLHYWNCDEYIGIGPAAHGFWHGRRYFYSRSLRDYLAGTSPTFDGLGGSEKEYILLRLRLAEGLTERGMLERFGHGIPSPIVAYAGIPAMKQFCTYNGVSLSLTRKGMLLSNSVIAQFLSLCDTTS